jgi:hypothetical protein
MSDVRTDTGPAVASREQYDQPNQDSRYAEREEHYWLSTRDLLQDQKLAASAAAESSGTGP